MINLSPAGTMIGLDILMIIYSLWAIASSKATMVQRSLIGAGMLIWLAVLHAGLANEFLFAKDITGMSFLLVILFGVAFVGVLLFAVPPLRNLLFGLDQSQLMLLQGVRVFFGAAFMLQASQHILPQTFGVIDGITHISAGFFGLTAAYSIAAKRNGSRRAWFANLFGLADILIVASTLALVLLPEIGPHHSMMYAVFLPAPLWLWFHVVSIIKLLQPQPAPTTASTPCHT